MIWFIFAIFAVWAICRTIEINSADYQRAKRERAQADREYEAAKRFRAQQEARTPEQVAADKELDEAREGVETADYRCGRWHVSANAPYDCWPHRGEPEYDSDRAESTAASARLTRAIEGRRAAFSPMKLTGG